MLYSKQKLKHITRNRRQIELQKIGHTTAFDFDESFNREFIADWKKMWAIAVQQYPTVDAQKFRAAVKDENFVEVQRHYSMILNALLDHFGHAMDYQVITHLWCDRAIQRWTRTMTTTTIAGQTIYHGIDNPTVRIHGGDWRLGFTRHAMYRIWDRVIACQQSRMDAMCVCNMIIGGLIGDPRSTDAGDEIEYWMGTKTGLGQAVAEAITGDPNADCDALMLYAPLVYHGKFALAKTVLYGPYTGRKRAHEDCLSPEAVNKALGKNATPEDLQRWQEQVRVSHAYRNLIRTPSQIDS